MKLGRANYEGSTGKKRFKLMDGDNVFRILPPMGSLADKGKWIQYYSVVWGYENPEGKRRPFQDCRVTNYRTKMVEVESAAYVKSEKIKAMYNDLKERAKRGENVGEDTLKKALNLVKRFNIEGKYYLNVMNLQGEIGLLKVGRKVKDALEVEIKKLMGKNVDPLSIDQGRFFNISKSGKMLNTTYQVTVYKEQRVLEGGEIAEFDKVHKLDDSIIARLANEAYDLGTLYTKTTVEQVEAIVNGANPDTVLGLSSSSQVEDDGGEDEEIPTTSVATSSQNLTQEIEKSIEKPKAEAPAPSPAPIATPAPSSSLANMTDEDFLAKMGVM
jgi:hypothetical protein